MCGFIGIVGNENVAADIAEGLVALQHRGQDAAGIATCDNSIHCHKGEGLVPRVMDRKVLGRLLGCIGVGHVRYPTVGVGGPEDAQPFTVNSPYGIAMVHNGNVTNYHSLRDQLIRGQHRHLVSCNDLEAVLHVFAQRLEREIGDGELGTDQIWEAVAEVFHRVDGTYSVVSMIAGKGLVAFRDPFGIKPMIIGRRTDGNGSESVCIASESVVMDILGYRIEREVMPGEAVFVHPDCRMESRQIAEPNHHPCIFEWVYFARPDSTIDDVHVYKARRRFGTELGRLWLKQRCPEADVVIPVPDSSRPAAQTMAEVLGIPYREGFVKNRYIGRTFIMPAQEKRQQSIRRKMNPIRMEFEGKRVLIVDDSIVRGNTSRAIVQMARQAGARAVYMASYSPPLKNPCVYGIDMSTRSEFIARDLSVEEIRERIGADYLLYQNLEGMTRAVTDGNPKLEKFCRACFDGNYPTPGVTPEILAAWERDRTR